MHIIHIIWLYLAFTLNKNNLVLKLFRQRVERARQCIDLVEILKFICSLIFGFLQIMKHIYYRYL